MAKPPQKIQKVMVQPINLIFRYLQNRSRVQVWLYENVKIRMEGVIVGFDEYMNLVLDDSCEVNMKSNERMQLGKNLGFIVVFRHWWEFSRSVS